ncbi:hypothetical protein A6I87_06405 [Prescottella equi]|nr:hypothetical protein A6I87_06405 [Prescottella equi]
MRRRDAAHRCADPWRTRRNTSPGAGPGQDPATRGGQQTVDLGHPIVTGDDARVAIRGGAPPAFACTLRIQARDQASSPILQPGGTRPVGTVE